MPRRQSLWGLCFTHVRTSVSTSRILFLLNSLNSLLANHLKFIQKFMEQKRQAKLCFKFNHFFHSAVMTLYFLKIIILLSAHLIYYCTIHQYQISVYHLLNYCTVYKFIVPFNKLLYHL